MDLPIDRPLNVAVVGLGFGKWILHDYFSDKSKNPHFRLAAVCDLDAAKAAEMARLHEVPQVSLDEVLADSEIDVVGLFTPPAGRAGLIRQIIRAGKHVMTTKPFERDIEAAREVLEEAASHGCVVHLNSPSPEPPVISTILRWQEEFDLGRPLGGSLMTWASYREVADGSWLDDPALCPVAPIFRLGIYLIHDALALFGDAEEVHVMSSRIFTGRPTPDHARMLMRFRSGSLVDIAASFCIDDGDFYRQKSHFQFERGSIYRNAVPGIFIRGTTHLCLVKPQGNQAEVVKEISLSAFDYDWAGFYRAIQNVESASPAYRRRILAGLEVIDAVKRSEASGQPARIGSDHHLRDIRLKPLPRALT